LVPLSHTRLEGSYKRMDFGQERMFLVDEVRLTRVIILLDARFPLRMQRLDLGVKCPKALAVGFMFSMQRGIHTWSPRA
jgi:hypothetical protein